MTKDFSYDPVTAVDEATATGADRLMPVEPLEASLVKLVAQRRVGRAEQARTADAPGTHEGCQHGPAHEQQREQARDDQGRAGSRLGSCVRTLFTIAQ